MQYVAFEEVYEWVITGLDSDLSPNVKKFGRAEHSLGLSLR